jgi:uncharacterized caspase-like protein
MTLAVVVAALVAGSTTVRAQPRDAFGRYHALVIGNQQYRSLPVLTTPVADARAVADVFRNDYRFANVRLLVNATRTEMLGALDAFRNSLGPNDNLVVYYAGHGYLDPDRRSRAGAAPDVG